MLLAAGASAGVIERRETGQVEIGEESDRSIGDSASKFVPKVSEPVNVGDNQALWPYLNENQARPHASEQIMFAPVNDPKVDRTKPIRLKPKKNHLVYLANANAQMNTDHAKPIDAALLVRTKQDVVNLAASEMITGIKCQGNQLTIMFKGETEKTTAKGLWGNNVIFMDAYGEGCGKEDELQFMQTSGAAKDGANSMTYTYSDITEADAVSTFKAAWGKEHKKAVQDIAPKNRRRQTDEDGEDLDSMFNGDWPEMGTMPLHAVDGQLRKRAFTSTWDKQFNVNWVVSTGKDDKTPFDDRKGIQLWQNKEKWMTVYCVECGVKGPISTSGAVHWTFTQGIVGGTAFFSQSVTGQVAIGIEVTKEVSKEKKRLLEKEWKKTFSFPLSPFHLGKFFIAGPAISLEPYAKAELKTSGKFLFGGKLSWDNAQAYYDFNDPQARVASGWRPTAKPIFELSAEIEAEASAGARLSLDFGLAVPVNNWKKGISIVDEAAVYTKASGVVGAYIDEQGSIRAGVRDTEKCHGITFDMGLSNRLYFAADLWEKKEYNLWKPDDFKPFPKQCWKYENMVTWYKNDQPVCGTPTDICVANMRRRQPVSAF